MAATTTSSSTQSKRLAKRFVKQEAEPSPKSVLKSEKYVSNSTTGHCENVIGRKKRSTKKKPLYGSWRGLFAGTRDF